MNLPLLPDWIAQWTGLGGAGLVIVAAWVVPLAAWWSRTAIGFARRVQLVVYALLAALVACVPVPIAGDPPLPLAAYVRGISGDLSVTSLLLLAAIVLARVTGAPLALVAGLRAPGPLTRVGLRDRLLLLLAIVAGAALLYPLALGAGWTDPYRWGYGHAGMLAALLALALVGWYLRAALTVACLCAALIAWSLRTHESTNLWDYLIDPWLALYAVLTLCAALVAASWRRVRASLQARDALLIGVAALGWLSLGLYAREPWKADEGYSFGLVLSIVRDGQWLVPTLAGEPFLEKPPLVFWLAAVCARLIAFVTGQGAGADALVPMHVAGRIANALLIAATFAFVYRAARWCERVLPEAPPPWLAALMLACAPAWLISSRYMTADLGFVLAAAMALAGFAAIDARFRWGGVLLGLALTAGLLSKGLLLPGVVVIVILLLPAISPRYRSAQALRQLLLALAVFGVLGAIWPVLLHQHSPMLFHTWLWDNNLGRFIGDNGLGPPSRRGESLLIIIGYLLPLWPFALAALVKVWRRGAGDGAERAAAAPGAAMRSPGIRADGARAGLRALQHSALLPAALLCAAWVLVTWASSTFRSIYLLPVFAPLALLAAAGMPRRFATGAAAGAGMSSASMRTSTSAMTIPSTNTSTNTSTTATVRTVTDSGVSTITQAPMPEVSSRPRDTLRTIATVLLALCALFAALLAAGLPLPQPNAALPLADGRPARLLWPLLVAALLPGLAAWKTYRGDRWQPAAAFALALLFVLALGLGLRLPRADLSAGFSPVFKPLAAQIDAGARCVASRKLGESERAMLDYYTSIRTIRFEVDPARAAGCDHVIEQVRPADRELPVCPGQAQRWIGNRVGDDGDRFRLCAAAR